MGTRTEGGLVARAVREALGTLVSPEMYGQLVARALKASRLEAIPEQGPEVARWMEGPLRREIERAVGDDAAELVASQLAPIAAHASGSLPRASAERPSRGFGSDQPTGVVTGLADDAAQRPRPPEPVREDLARTARVRLSPEQLQMLRREAAPDQHHTTRPQAFEGAATSEPGPPRVLAASADPKAMAALRQALAAGGGVAPILDLVGLLDVLDAPGLREPVVLIDCRRPTVHVTSVIAIGEDLPPGTTVVLWGAPDEVWRDLDRNRTPGCRWVRCSHEATHEDVGSLCAMLLG